MYIYRYITYYTYMYIYTDKTSLRLIGRLGGGGGASLCCPVLSCAVLGAQRSHTY